MTVEEAVIARINAIAAVTALVGTRVYNLKIPQSPTYPLVKVQLIDEGGTYTHDGRSRPKKARVQVDAYAQETSGGDPYAEAIAVDDAIMGNGVRATATGLDAFQGNIGSPAFRISGVMAEDRTMQYESQELGLVRCRRDYMVGFYDPL